MDYEDSPDAALTQPFQPIPQDVYAEFFKTRLPPKGTVIYIALRQMRQHPSGGHALSTDLNLPGPDADHPEKIGSIYAVTFFIQNIVFQVEGYSMSGRFQPNVVFPQEFQPFVQRVWPLGMRVLWPPENPTLSEKQTMRFAFALNRISPGSTV